MMGINKWAMGAAAVLSLIGASSATAANWDPQNTNVTATQEGSGTFAFGAQSFACQAGSTTLRASGAVATAVGTVNPVVFSSCTGPLGVAATVTTFGDWQFIATSTTTVDITVIPTASNNKVATIHFGGFACDITITGHQALPNDVWSNANRTLSISGNFVNIDNSGGFCGSFGSTATLTANFQAATGTTIT